MNGKIEGESFYNHTDHNFNKSGFNENVSQSLRTEKMYVL